MPQMPSARVRARVPPSSKGRKKLITQAGEVTNIWSPLPASESQDSTLHSPGLPISESSTPNAPAARAVPASGRLMHASAAATQPNLGINPVTFHPFETMYHK